MIEIIKDQSEQLNLFGDIFNEDYFQRIWDETQIKDSSRPKQLELRDFSPYEKRTYSQDWPSYDKAKTNQSIFFKEILQELLFLAIKEEKPKRGGQPYSIRNRLFAMCIKVFYRSDLRKCTSILKELKRLNYIDKVPCYKSIDNFFNDESMNEILDDLIFISALPLSKLEYTGAIDATGFSVSRFDSWNKYKWGKKEGKERVWRKAHALAGCTSNIFISVKVTQKNVGDARMFEDVVGNRPKYFEMKNFVADKAYSARRILDFIHNLGINPYIPFKSNVSTKSRRSLIWRQLLHKFRTQNVKFMKNYNQRSNIETSFHMVKTRFGDHLMTKKFIANVNEVKVKFLCHNLLCLIQEVFEREINIDFSSCVMKAGLCNE